MKKNHIAIALLISTIAFTTIAVSDTTTIDLQDVPSGTTLISNTWQLNEVTIPGVGTFNVKQNTSIPYKKNTNDGLGEIILSPIVNLNDNSHIHVSGGDGDPNTPTKPFIHGDVGGVFIAGSGSLETFSFHSMDILTAILQSDKISHSNSTITVRGFLGGTNNMMTGDTEADAITMQYNGGAKVAETTLFNGVTGTFDFLAADTGFSEVDYIEFSFTDFYRQKPSSLGDTTLEFDFDNIVVGTIIDVPDTPDTPPDALSPTAHLPPIPLSL